MTSAYGTLANGGEHCTPYAIADVTSSKGRILEVTTPRCDRAIPSDVAAEETAMLQNVIAFGTGTAANIGRPEAGKTGTGNDYEDAWFVGYVPQLVTGVWVGYAEAEIPMPEVPGYGHGFGGVLAAPIWHDFMLFATLGLSPIGFAPPPSPIAASPSPSPTPTASPTPSPATTSTPTPTPPVTPAPSPTVTPTPTPSTTPSG
jgi:penicillin-binding protein 1A